MERDFGSDNFSGVLPEVLKALEAASYGHQHSYGADIYSDKAIADFRQMFGEDTQVYFVFNGTAANVLSLLAFTQSYHAIICTETAHINVDECGAVERHTGCKLLTVPTVDGKLTVELIRRHLHGIGDQHHVQPGVVSIAECTELGTVYTPDEIREICDFAHSQGLYVHVDGARLANAVAYLGVQPAALIRDPGVDVLSFGGTKNGMLFGEAALFFSRPLKEVKYLRKQLLQLHSKSRFIAAQFSAVLKDNLWLKSAGHSNAMAQLLAREVSAVPGVKVTQKVQGNEVFAILPGRIEALQEECFFYVWDENTGEVRWVCSFDTTEEDIAEFVKLLQANA
ncbi:MAG: low specificity L-threonine aldolase [Tannerella sp.]|nr:low specificity L-threonine aldolase [Tannerella sp.]